MKSYVLCIKVNKDWIFVANHNFNVKKKRRKIKIKKIKNERRKDWFKIKKKCSVNKEIFKKKKENYKKKLEKNETNCYT